MKCGPTFAAILAASALALPLGAQAAGPPAANTPTPWDAPLKASVHALVPLLSQTAVQHPYAAPSLGAVAPRYLRYLRPILETFSPPAVAPTIDVGVTLYSRREHTWFTTLSGYEGRNVSETAYIGTRGLRTLTVYPPSGSTLVNTMVYRVDTKPFALPNAFAADGYKAVVQVIQVLPNQ